ncbi:MAG: hypothetical protein Q8P67_06690 [archaeon]|nr:hypothetical protein [archaeon]
MAFSVACSDDRFEPPYFDRSHLPFPPLNLRVALASAQMLIYYERFQFSQAMLKLFFQLFEKESHHFSKRYCQQVRLEYIQATKSAATNPAASESDEEALDLMLSAMLDREVDGNFDIEDDFDSQFGSFANPKHMGSRKIKRQRPSNSAKSNKKIGQQRPRR